MSQVISVSRRTDIPAFYANWFINRLREGFAVVQQPYSRKFIRVSLQREDVSAIVFWSKNYAPLLGKLNDIEGTSKNLFFHFTITAMQELESSVPDYRDAIRDYRFIAARYSSAQIIWRFDPVCITDRISFEMLEERFRTCAQLLHGYARQCVISFVHPYKKVLANMKKYSVHHLTEISNEQKKAYACRLASIATSCGIQVTACCNDYLLSHSVRKASCIDGRLLSRLFDKPVDVRPASTRKECACTRSVDIGAYDTCSHGCVYCYANTDRETARAAAHRHDPRWNSLGRDVPNDWMGSEEQVLFRFL